ncbi:hypothetical protein [Streptomyces cinereoruber]|uniref:hypothetical protein n=1 Tax=Streptomyces cinereoruber TaxID=67260 RepID=UPI003668C792
MSAAELTWRVLGALRLREVRLEGVDEADRTFAVGRLRGVVATGTADAADLLFSRLCELVGRYAPAAATKTIGSLRRDLIGFPLVRQSSQDDDAGGAGDVRLHPPKVRSAYLAQVRRIAPEQLLGRDEELAEMERFSTGPDAEQYLWWRAQAWAGKSALLSTFVLKPPPGARVISFFITARWAGQADSAAFTEVVLEQVLELLGEPMPMLLTNATREAHLLGAFERAADLCRRRGESLTLVVDGLDEDSGVTTAPDAHSIAAILPANPPAGMRVIVASRVNPPIPSDVPDDHPLRRPGTVRSLLSSPYAEVVRQDAERELKRLLRGSAIERDLLGLLTAAGGGLSEADLAQLTGLSAWEVEDQLRAVSARTFSPRAGRWQPQVAVYVLGHEEIQQQAQRFLGEDRLVEYRDRIHGWADGYRDKKWPVDTPEYLLRGYFKLLHAAGDNSRLLAAATDPDRHHRMLDIIGGDGVALSEIVAVQEVLSAQPVPDLVALSRLAVHRIKLTERNNHVPSHLPVVWAQLGRYNRAEALARSITTPARQVRALASVARHMAEHGDLLGARAVGVQAEQSILSIVDADAEAHAYAVVARAAARAGDIPRARILVARAEGAARSLADGPQREHALCAVARSVAANGDVGQALAIAKSLRHWSERAQALCGVVTEVADAGDWRKGLSVANSIGPRSDRAHALAVVARTANMAGARRRATDIATQAEALALSIRNPGRRAWILAAVARELAEVDGDRRARDLLHRAEKAANAESRVSVRSDALVSIAGVMALSGAQERAAVLARKLENPYRQAKALAIVASGLAVKGELQRAEEIAGEAEAIARSVNGRDHVVRDQAVLAQATASAGDLSHACEIARAITDISQRDRTLTFVAEAIALTGDLDQADEVATSIADETQRSKALLLLVKAGVNDGARDRAGRIARSIQNPEYRGKALALLPRTAGAGHGANAEPTQADVATQGSPQLEQTLEASQGENKAPSVHLNPYAHAKELTTRATTALEYGDVDLARSVVESISVPALRVRALMSLSSVLAETGKVPSSREFSNRALDVISAIPNRTHRDQMIMEVAQWFAIAGDPDRAEQLVRSIASPPLRQRALAAVASATAKSGQLVLGERMARKVSDAHRRTKSLAAIVQVAVGSGALDEAERIARSIADPLRQSRALGAVAHACAADGDFARAEAIAATIADPYECARTLTALAVDFDNDSSRSLLAQALSIGHWSICLPALLRLEPAVVAAVGAEFLRANE